MTQLKRGVSRAADERIRKMRKPGSTLYLLEEPTIGLHMADIELLLNVLHRLVDEGNTVIVIEHNLSVIAEADYIVDLGPEAGADGGEVVACGTPEQVAKNRVSRTAPFLRKVLRGTRDKPRGHPERSEGPRNRAVDHARRLRDQTFGCEVPRRLAVGMTRVFVAAVAHFCESRRNARVLSAQSRSDHFSHLRQCRAALVRPVLMCLHLSPAICSSSGWRNADMPICPATSRRLHHWLRAVWRDHWRASRLRFLLQTGNAARAAVDLSRLGRRNVQPRRNAWSVAFHFVLRAPAQNLVDKPRRQSGCHCADWFVLWTLRQFHQRRTLWTDDERSLGDAIPKGTVRSSPGSRARGGGVRANRSIAGDTRRNRWRGSQPATSGHRVALNSFAAPSLAALRGFFEGIVLFAILWFVRTRRREPNGVLTGLFFICYAIFRIVIEYFREPDATLVGPFTRGQFFSFFLIAIGLGFVAVAKMRPTYPQRTTKHE